MEDNYVIDGDMENLKYNEIVRIVSSLDNETSRFVPLKLAFLRNITIEPAIPYLKYLAYAHSIRLDIKICEYDKVMQEVIDINSPLYCFSPDVIIVAMKLDFLSPRLGNTFLDMGREAISREVSAIRDFLDTILSELRKRTNAFILLHNFESPVYPALGILDLQRADKQVNTVRRINGMLVEMTNSYDSCCVVDMDLLQSRIGYVNYVDNRYWHLARAPYTHSACREIMKEYLKFFLSLRGRNKKCLVLDCDNTLWGGIIGEDGIDRIQIGTSYPGSAFREFQLAVLSLYSRGVMLAVCSKNNENDVMEVFEEHPEMLLKKEHFLSMKINWKDKVSNIREIAEELNIGLDSMVVIDDSDFEINLLKQMLPEVVTIRLSGDPSFYRDTLRACGLFDTLAASEEDVLRNEMYKTEMLRREAKKKFASQTIEQYLKSLEMEVVVSYADNMSISRISQLTQKTNQFNLTTRRYSEVQIKDIASSGDWDVLCLRLKDRFGDSGIVGVAILRFKGIRAEIDTFLLSCRVLGRGVEDVLLKICVNKARARNCSDIIGFYFPTGKNLQVESFYVQHQFAGEEHVDGGMKYSLPLSVQYADFPSYFKSIKEE